MFSTRVRLILILFSLVVGIQQLSIGEPRAPWLLLFAGLLTYGHFRYGPVWLAFRAIRAGDIDKGARLLAQVRKPTLLSSQQRAYYEMGAAAVAEHRQENELAESHYRAALDHALRTDNDRGAVEVSLAEILAARGDLAEARELIDRARRRACKPALREHIDRIAESLGQRPEPH